MKAQTIDIPLGSPSQLEQAVLKLNPDFWSDASKAEWSKWLGSKDYHALYDTTDRKPTTKT